MPAPCACGRVPGPGDLQCSLCGRDLAVDQGMVPHLPGPGAGSASRSPRAGLSPGLLVVVPVLLVLAVAVTAFLLLRPREPVLVGPPDPGSTSGPAAGAGAASSEEPVSDPSSSPADAPVTPDPEPTSEPPVEPSLTDPPGREPLDAQVVRGSDGAACTPLRARSDYGDYPMAQCKMWQRSEGLLTGETLGKGAKKLTCQRDLDADNPVFKSGQTNTWWAWTTSDDGTWDWFPETAVAQGAPDQPINGIARCQDAS